MRLCKVQEALSAVSNPHVNLMDGYTNCPREKRAVCVFCRGIGIDMEAPCCFERQGISQEKKGVFQYNYLGLRLACVLRVKNERAYVDTSSLSNKFIELPLR